MNTTQIQELMAYEVRVKGYLDWRFWSDSFGVQVSDESGGVYILRGTVSSHAAIKDLVSRLRFEGARLLSPVALTPITAAG